MYLSNKKIHQFLAISLVGSMMTTFGLNISASNLKGSDGSVNVPFMDGAPVIYVQNDDKLPQAMQDNIKAQQNMNKAVVRGEKHSLMNNFINSEAYSDMETMSRALVRPQILDIYQNPQDRDYYCGYACLQSILEYYDVEKSQSEIASESYDVNDALAWFAGSESQAADEEYYPAAVYLNNNVDHYYEPYNSYFGTFTADDLAEFVKSDIDYFEAPVMICGISKANNSDGSRLPGYPTNINVGHWIVADGYIWETNTQSVTGIQYIDPAKSDVISWSDNISAYASTDLTNMFKFARSRGIIW